MSPAAAIFGRDEKLRPVADYPFVPRRRGRVPNEQRAAHPFEPRPGVRLSLSISAGPARFPNDGHSFDELLAAADERMYRDKAVRRSRSALRQNLIAQT